MKANTELTLRHKEQRQYPYNVFSFVGLYKYFDHLTEYNRKCGVVAFCF